MFRMKIKLPTADIFLIICLSIAVRAIISLGPYSGKGKPPMFGDYEAQRHWQELTFNLPAKEWYKNSTSNDLLYWGLDYPPLTAYHSYLNGLVASNINSSYIKLKTSQGFETKKHNIFMRWTVLVSDVIIYLPACVLLVMSTTETFQMKNTLSLLCVITIYPGLILIDNGHFQYNNISLGFMLLAVWCIMKNSNYMAALLFSLALNYKQMELYHAVPFFVYLLKDCIKESKWSKIFHKFLKIAGVVLLTFAVLWIPWLHSFNSLTIVLRRLFPISRGPFEDKVANFWCSINVIYKFRKIFSHSQTAVMCLCTTVVAISPASIHLFKNSNKKTFLYALFNVALAFFLFSFQVHEKSILLAALPAIFLFTSMPIVIGIFLKLSTLSLFPLLIKDELTLQYFVLSISYNIILNDIIKTLIGKDTRSTLVVIYINIVDVLVMGVSLIALYVTPPSQLPDLWSVVISLLCCGYFIVSFLIGHIKQFNFLNIDKIKIK